MIDRRDTTRIMRKNLCFGNRLRGRVLTLLLVGWGLLSFWDLGRAHSFRVTMIPNGNVNQCSNCHLRASGGGPRNLFGQEVDSLVGPGSRTSFWSETLANLDSDGDGFTNGEELGDPDGDGTAIRNVPVTNPGDPNSRPPMPDPVEPDPPASVEVVMRPDLPAFGAPMMAAQAAIASIVPVEINGTSMLEIAWNEGHGPFLLEKKGSLRDTVWRGVQGFTDSPALVENVGGQGFFQVSDLSEAPPTLLTASLGGDFERPDPVATDGFGMGHFRLDGHRLTFEVHYTNLSAPAVASHIHGSASTAENAGVMVDLAPFNGGEFGVSGVLKGSVELVPSEVAALLTGKTYINIHTPNHPGGEIRGQIAPVQHQVSLNGSAERPNSAAGSGFGSGVLSLIGRELSFRVLYDGLTAPATAAHIHGPASVEESSGVLINLEPFNGGSFGTSGSFAGSVVLTSEQLSALIDGATYINVHTPNNPPGEIRGQILRQVTGEAFSTELSGLFESPEPVETDGFGVGTLSLTGNALRFNIHYGGLSAAATAGHIHGMASTEENAGVLIDLEPFALGGFGAAGVIRGTVEVSSEQAMILKKGMAYINLHTPNHPAGEIRGQVAPVLLGTQVTGEAERPVPVLSLASGMGTLSMMGRQLSLNVLYSGLSGAATAAHIHGRSGVNESGGVLLNLEPFNGIGFGAAGMFAGSVDLDDATLQAMVDGQTYVNVHTPDHGPGEIRGQILPGALKPFGLSAALSGVAARPEPVTTTGSGRGSFALIGNELHFVIDYADLSGDAVAAHIHGPAWSTETGGVLIDLEPFNGGSFGSSGQFSGMITVSEEQRWTLMDGKTYVNIHTAMNPSGEIRGQIAAIDMTVHASGAAERPVPVATDGIADGQVKLIGNELLLNVRYQGLSEPATAAHIHGASNPEQTAGVLVNLEPLNGGAFGSEGVLRGAVEIAPEQLGAFIDHHTYLNIHSPANPAGEIRGQLVRGGVMSMSLVTTLSGQAARPAPVTTSAGGSGTFTIVGDLLYFSIGYEGLSGPATAAHIHGPASEDETAGVLLNLEPFNGDGFGDSGTLSGAVTLSPELKLAVMSGLAYVNIHTAMNPSGEVRGQILKP